VIKAEFSRKADAQEIIIIIIESPKEQHLFKILCNIINVLTVTLLSLIVAE